MVRIDQFVFSPFQENTFILSNDEKDAWIIDPGCSNTNERKELEDHTAQLDLNPVRLINTHCHLDHVFGNAYVHKTYGLLPEYHKLDEPTMKMAPISASMYGIPGFEPSPAAENHITEGDELTLGTEVFEVRFCPGHAPGHVVFIHHSQKFVIGGDVLFRESIGRTDLPGGDHQTLLDSIRKELFSLPDDYTVFCGHGPETTIGHEKKNNPFLN